MVTTRKGALRLRHVVVAAIALVAVAAFVAALRQGRDAKPLPGISLRELGRQRGLLIGTAVRADVQKRNLAYRQLIAQQFSSVTPENEMKWYLTEPSRGRFSFGAGDEVVGAAEKAGQAVRGHTLVWYSQLPGWVDGLSAADLAAAMRTHIQQEVGHYAGRVGVWDVVNEAITDGGGMRQSVFERRLGPGYIASAFATAHAADPNAKLYINEIGAESIGPKSNRLYSVVRSLKAAGVPIDGVGFQVHSNLRGVPDDFVANMQRFKALGVDVAITEADVALKVPASAADLRAQADVYTTIVRSCLAVQCASLTFWGFTDGRSWISETEAGMGAADLLDTSLRPKPAFAAVQQALAR
jgi:endo-1,4-beta-xylanase